MKYSKIGLLFLALFAVSACSETQLLFHTAKRIQKEVATPGDGGGYKVGNPYQIKGVWYYPAEDYDYRETGIASWYGPGFHGKLTANGETYDQNALTAAHRTLPMPSLVQVTNLQNGRSLKLRVNDRGPFARGRIIDVSRRASQLLGFHRRGTARVRVEILADESRILASRLKNEIVVARAELPIRSDVDVSKPGVSASSLPPPSGARIQEVTGEVASAPADPIVRTAPPSVAEPDGNVTVTPVTPTKIYIQAGAFNRYENAHRAQAHLADFTNVKISSIEVDGKEFFRVRAGPIRTVKRADQMLDHIIDAGYQDARIVVD